MNIQQEVGYIKKGEDKLEYQLESNQDNRDINYYVYYIVRGSYRMNLSYMHAAER